MTSIVANPYPPQYTTYPTGADNRPQPNRPSAPDQAQSGAATVTLSQAAKAALGEKTISTVVADALAAMKRLLTETNKTSPLKDGALAVDLAGFDRRELFAMASNAEGQFPPDQQQAASIELQRRFDAALAGPAAIMRLTGDYKALYDLASDYLEAAGAEEKASGDFQKYKAAIDEALAQLAQNPDSAPSGVGNDPVANYLERAAKDSVSKPRDFSAVTNDARAALDAQHANAKAEGKALVFDGDQRAGKPIDLSRFGGRSLSAMALNNDDQFSSSEMRAAKSEMNARMSAAVQTAFKHSSASGDPTAFSKNLIAQYAALSNEEREAAGLTPQYYETIVSNYETSQKISQSFSGLSALFGSSSANKPLSLIDFL